MSTPGLHSRTDQIMASRRPKQYRETHAFIGAARRFIRAAGKRVADGDEPELRELVSLRIDLENAITAGVRGQRAIGRSWAHIGNALGISRQAAFQKWGDTE